MTEILFDIFMSKNGQLSYRISEEYAKAINRTSELKNLKEFAGIADISNETPLVKVCIQAWQKAVNRYREANMPPDEY